MDFIRNGYTQPMNTKTKQYFLRAMTGKTRAARLLDRLLLCAAVYIIAYFWLRRQINHRLFSAWLAALAAGLALACYLLWFSIRLDRFTERETARLARLAVLERLLLLPPSRVMDVLLGSDPALSAIRAVAVVEKGFVARFPDGKKVLYALLKKHPAEPVTATEVLLAHQQALSEGCTELVLYSTAEYCEEALALVRRGVIDAALNPPDRLLELARSLELVPDEACVQAAVAQQIAARRSLVTSASILKGGPRRYLLCAALLCVLSCFTAYRLYYLLTAGFCLALAVLSARAAGKSQRSV